MRFFQWFSIVVLVLVATFIWQYNQPKYQILEGNIFGTYYRIKVKTPVHNQDLDANLQKEFALVNNQMSVFTNNSEINRLNYAPAGEWRAVSPQLFSVLEESQKIHQQSQGLFDPTVGQLVNLWGFGLKHKQQIPPEKDIKKLLQAVGFDKISLKKPNLVKKSNKDTYLNLSAIAKGYAVDRVGSMLKNQGYENFVVDIGGEILAAGNKDKGLEGWNIGIAIPLENSKQNLLAITLQDMAVATSGDYRNYYYLNGKRFSHTISPKTGHPVEHQLVSATVFDKSCMNADGYATALMSMGENDGLKFANQHNLAVILMVKDSNDHITSIYSKQANHLMGESEDGTN